MDVKTYNAEDAQSVTPDDSNDLTPAPANALYVGSQGDVKVDMMEGTTVTFTAVPAGTVLNIRVNRVYSTDTTASGIVALY